MALGLVHVRGNLCRYSSKAEGNRRAPGGKFVRCRPAGKRGYVVDTRSTKPAKGKSKPTAKRRSGSSTAGNCKLVKTKMFGQGAKKQCRKVCWGTNGKIKSNRPSKGCR